MKVNVKQFLEEAGITEPFYPGKRLVHTCQQAGEFKSHCVVLDWRQPDKIRMEIKAGLTGKSLTAKELKSYPVSFQLPTYVDIEVINDNKDDDEEGSSSSSSSSGGGGKQPKKSLASFSAAMEGKIPALGRIIDVVIMGKKIAVEAYAGVMGTLAKQISHSKVAVTDLLAHAGNFVTKYMPPSFMAPTGDEQKTYKYDREKNADIGFRPGPG